MMSPWPCVSRNVILSFFLQSGLSAPATSFPWISSALLWCPGDNPGKPACSKAPRVLTHYLRFLGRISHLGMCKWSHLQDCAERHVNLGTWICQRRQLKRCRLPSVPPAPRVSGIRPHSRRPCVCSLPLLSPLLTFVVKIWKGCTGIQIVHLPFLCTGAKIQASYYVHNHSKL